MQKLYLDCDGVILDTINKSYQMIKERGIKGEDNVNLFYRSICWEELIVLSGEINNAISKIKELSKYFDIEILTHVVSNSEARAKINYFYSVLPDINVIPVPKSIAKADYVDPKGAILVDDFTPNLDKWSSKGGISVKFSDSYKDCSYIVISDLLELLELDFVNKIKVKE